MPRDTLLDFFEDFSTSDDLFLVHDDGYRVRQATYREVAAASRAFAARLAGAGIGPDDKVAIWSENRIEWVVALWGCLLRRVVLVPIDFRASADLLARITAIVQAKAVLLGDETHAPAGLTMPVWKLTETVTFAGTSGPPGNPLEPPGTPGTLGTSGSTLAEVIFTSGATADPKGVTITHRNLLANIIPIEREIAEVPHVRAAVSSRAVSEPAAAQSHVRAVDGDVRAADARRDGRFLARIQSDGDPASDQVAPDLGARLRAESARRAARPHRAPCADGGRSGRRSRSKHFLWRWWRYRAIHRLFGWKFWCIVCGAAPLEPELEAFWRKLGFLVVQGYGLTETAPIVTLNHPFSASRGSVGKPIEGVEVRIADDGEILVRGDNVTSGYYRPAFAEATAGKPAPADESSAFADGWFHTGDIGELDASGRLVIKGRKKEMIATPQGLKVFPEDVERALLAQPGVNDAGVVGRVVNGEERIHAVLVLAPGADAESIVRGANATLEDHQRVWSTSVWPGDALPRTEGTQKLKRKELQRWVAGSAAGATAAVGRSTTVEEVVARFVAGRDLSRDTTLDELGLSSLDRVEMLMALEEAFQVTLDESALADAKTIGDLALARPARGDAGGRLGSS